MPSKCHVCGSSLITKDDGHTTCVVCGTVLEDTSLVTDEIQFGADSSVVGQFVSNTGRVFGSSAMTSREYTIETGKRSVAQVASVMHLKNSVTDAAQRFFVLAAQRNFTQGRRSSNVVAACLYIACRRERTPHLLIDFADVLHANVFTLGQTFLRLCRLLNIQLPLADPSLYIQRFASQLDLGDSTLSVAHTALRIVQRMGRDWIHTGRRPAGICGAGLLLACRLHGFKRAPSEVAHVVRIGDATLRKRLYEFEATAASGLTLAQIDDENEDQEEEMPPAFTAGKKRDERQKQQRESLISKAHAKITAFSTPKSATTPFSGMNEAFEEYEKETESKKRKRKKTPKETEDFFEKETMSESGGNILERAIQQMIQTENNPNKEIRIENIEDLIKEMEKEFPSTLNHDAMENEIISTFISEEFLKTQSEFVRAFNYNQSEDLAPNETFYEQLNQENATQHTQENSDTNPTDSNIVLRQPVLRKFLPEDTLLFDSAFSGNPNEQTTTQLESVPSSAQVSDFSSSFLSSNQRTVSNAIDNVLFALGTDMERQSLNTQNEEKSVAIKHLYEPMETEFDVEIDDSEINDYLLPQDEIMTRTKVWTEVNKNWLANEAKKEEENKNKPQKKARKKRKSALYQTHTSAADATKAALASRTSTKVNWDALGKLLDPSLGLGFK